jgi:hypothetical protein
MTGPPAASASQSEPGGYQARADGQQVEVRTYEGELIRIVREPLAECLVQAQLADDLGHCLRLKLGIRWLPPRLDRPSGRPDLKCMQRRDPERYGALWRGTGNAHVGKGALGRSAIDRSVRVRPAGCTPNHV